MLVTLSQIITNQVQPLSFPIKSIWISVFSGAACNFLPFITFSTMLFIDPTGALHWEIPVAGVCWSYCGTGACLELSGVLVYPLLNQLWCRDRSKDSETDGQRPLEFVPFDEALTCDPTSSSGLFCFLLFQLTTNPGRQQFFFMFNFLCTKMLFHSRILFSSWISFFGFVSSEMVPCCWNDPTGWARQQNASVN